MNRWTAFFVIVLWAFPFCAASAIDCPRVAIQAERARLVLPEGTAELSNFTLQCSQGPGIGAFHVQGSGSIKTRAKTKTGFVDASYSILLRDKNGKQLARHEFPALLDFCVTCHPNGDNQQTESFDYTFSVSDGQSLKDSRLEMGWVPKKN